MACATSTAPINISSKGKVDDCSLKCQFKYNYPRSPATTITNNGNYLGLSYDKVIVNYNDNELRVQDIRLYIPSLHTFNGNRGDGELIIRHVGMGISLLVCIPIVISSSKSDASKNLSFLVNTAVKRTPNIGESAVISVNDFTLNSFIPKRKPFYSYSGTLPYAPCNGEHQYIVFMPKTSPVFISSGDMGLLKKMLIAHDSTIKAASQYFVNQRGAIFTDPTSDEGDDDIYIECHPTGANGEPIPVPQDGGNTNKGDVIDFSNPIVITLLGILGGVLLIVLLSTLIKFFRSRRAATAAATASTSATDLGSGE